MEEQGTTIQNKDFVRVSHCHHVVLFNCTAVQVSHCEIDLGIHNSTVSAMVECMDSRGKPILDVADYRGRELWVRQKRVAFCWGAAMSGIPLATFILCWAIYPTLTAWLGIQ